MSEPDALSTIPDGMGFRLVWNGAPVTGVRRVGPLRRTSEVITYRDVSGLEQKVPGRTEYDAVVVELDLSHDRAFAQWAGGSLQSPGNAPADHGRKNVRIELHDTAGQAVMAFDLFRCWVSEYQALPDVRHDPAVSPAVFARIECEGWARDFSVPDPVPPVDV